MSTSKEKYIELQSKIKSCFSDYEKDFNSLTDDFNFVSKSYKKLLSETDKSFSTKEYSPPKEELKTLNNENNKNEIGCSFFLGIIILTALSYIIATSNLFTFTPKEITSFIAIGISLFVILYYCVYLKDYEFHNKRYFGGRFVYFIFYMIDSFAKLGVIGLLSFLSYTISKELLLNEIATYVVLSCLGLTGIIIALQIISAIFIHFYSLFFCRK